jgi:hypothetical protein
MSRVVSYHRVKNAFDLHTEEILIYVTELVTEKLDLHRCLNKIKGKFFPPDFDDCITLSK